MEFKQQLIIELLKATPILIIGLITAYIAFRQYKIEKSMLSKELYQTRLRVYIVIATLYEFLQDYWKDHHPGKRSSGDITKFWKENYLVEHHFVFSEELCSRIDGIRTGFWLVIFQFEEYEKEDMNVIRKEELERRTESLMLHTEEYKKTVKSLLDNMKKESRIIRR